MSTVISRWTGRLRVRKALRRTARVAVNKATKRLRMRKKQVAQAERVIARHKDDVATAAKALWNPAATKKVYSSAGSFTGGGRKIVWHTTEGGSLPVYSGDAPHFTLNPKTGELWQHIPINESAKALEHHNASETNRANAIQVELIGYAAESHTWPSSYYDNIAKLARWIEHNAGVPCKCSVDFRVGVARLSDSEFVNYAGHLGHAHVPQQWAGHWDPGAFRIAEVV